MDGWQFLARLKEMPAWEAVPVVVVSSTAQIPIVIVTAKDLSPQDRHPLNEHVLDIAGKAHFDPGRFMGAVQRALCKVE